MVQQRVSPSRRLRKCAPRPDPSRDGRAGQSVHLLSSIISREVSVRVAIECRCRQFRCVAAEVFGLTELFTRPVAAAATAMGEKPPQSSSLPYLPAERTDCIMRCVGGRQTDLPSPLPPIPCPFLPSFLPSASGS